MKALRALCTLMVAAVLLLPQVASAGAAPSFLPGIRPLGMGNAFVGVADDRNALHYNPAGLARLERTSISGLGLHGGIDNEFFEIVQFIQDNEDRFSDIANIDQEFYNSLAQYDDKWVATDAHAYADMTRPGFGIGAYTTGRLQFKIDRGVYEPRVHANVFDDIVAVGGAGMDLGRWDVQVGASMKAIWRRESTRALSAREMADFDPADILDDLAAAEPGFSMDLGAHWQPPESSWGVGAVIRDAAGFVAGERIDPALDMGASWRGLQEGYGPMQGVLVAADLRDTFGSDLAMGSKIHMGAEVALPFLSVRGGFSQGYPTAGATLGLKVFELDYAFHGRELGDFPGAESQFLHAVEARLGFF